MEQRKLIKHGPSSLVFTLPSKWIKNNNLSKGNLVLFKEANNDLIISAKKVDKTEITNINISKLDLSTAIHYMQSKYRYGFDEIKIEFDNQEIIKLPDNKKQTTNSLIYYIATRFVGLEVVEQDKKSTTIKRITKDDGQNFQQVLRRVFLLLKSSSNEFVEMVSKNKKETYKLVKEKHDYINSLTNYCLRLISNGEIKNSKDSLLYYHILSQIEVIMDTIKYSSYFFDKDDTKSTKYFIEAIEMINNHILKYYDLFYSFDIKKTKFINEQRWKIKDFIEENLENLTRKEIQNITRMESIVEIIIDITESRMGLEKEEK